MEHKAFLASLDGDTAAALTARRDRPALVRLALQLGVITACALWVALGGPFWGVALGVQALFMIFLFTLEHECTHKTPFESERLNDLVGRSCGVILLIPFTWFRYFHLAHHRHTNIPGKDPELQGDSQKYTHWGPFLLHVSGIPVWKSLLQHVFAAASGRAEAVYLPQSVRPRVIHEARWHLALYALALLSLLWSPLLFWLWIAPLIIGQPVLRLYLMAEHGRCAFAANMFDNTRTTYTHALLRYIAWNMPYHTAHHVHPNVPFHALPEFHAMIEKHVTHKSASYTDFTSETLRDLSSKT
ncbi:MAG: fatty acid desaturase [Marinovum sp.]|nr:fatty acid desaturase [Marinovum sp.]